MQYKRARAGTVLVILVVAAAVLPTQGEPRRSLRMGPTGSIVATHKSSNAQVAESVDARNVAGAQYPHPRPRLAGFQPLVAITTSSKTSNVDLNFEHALEASYDCTPHQPPSFNSCGSLNPSAASNFIVGVFDTGSITDLASGIFADTLGLFGQYVTSNVLPIGGVGGSVDALVTQPVGWYAAGLSSVNSAGQLDISALVGHSNSAGLVAPPIICDETIAVTGFVGTPFIAFYNTVINVDIPRRVQVGGFTYKGPDIQIQQPFEPLPEYPHSFSLEIGGLSPVTTASYYPDVKDLETPTVPTLLSLSPLSFPTGAMFFANLQLRDGPASAKNPPIQRQFMLDTGAQASIISRGTAADLNLPQEPDFTVDICGVNGVQEGVSGYYVDYARISALGGPLEYSRIPFIVEDLPSPAGGTLDGIIGMNFFWNRNVALESSLTSSSFFHVSAPIPFAFGDFDADMRVDSDDMFFWEQCRTAPGESPLPDCDHLDGNEDGDVDMTDFAWFQRCFSGSETPAEPTCQ